MILDTEIKRLVDLKYTPEMDTFIKGALGVIMEEHIHGIQKKLDFTYTLAKLKHASQKRQSGEEFFTHLQEVAKIILYELPEPNLDEVILALLHDIIEDTTITYTDLRKIFGKTMAEYVRSISKKPYIDYLTSKEKKKYHSLVSIKKKEYKKLHCETLKKRRNKDFFEGMKDISFLAFKVKCADRIHNLRTLMFCSEEKILRKIKETEKYFLPLAKEIYPEGYKLLQKEINNLHISWT